MSDANTTYSKVEIDIADYIFAHPDKKREDVLSQFVAKYHKHRRTIERYHKRALEYNTTRQNKIEKAKHKVLVAEAKELTKEAILSRSEALTILSEIANNKQNTPPERTTAIRTLADIEGWKAPVKNEHTGKNGDPIEHEHRVADHKVIFEGMGND